MGPDRPDLMLPMNNQDLVEFDKLSLLVGHEVTRVERLRYEFGGVTDPEPSR